MSLEKKRGRLETGERWRNKLREIVTSPVPQRQEESDSYDKLFKEMLPQSLWRLVNDEGERGEPPFVMLEKVTLHTYHVMPCFFGCSTCFCGMFGGISAAVLLSLASFLPTRRFSVSILWTTGLTALF